MAITQNNISPTGEGIVGGPMVGVGTSGWQWCGKALMELFFSWVLSLFICGDGGSMRWDLTWFCSQ